MSRVCSVCGKGSMSGNNVSHSLRKSRRSWGANVHKVRILNDNGSITSAYVCTDCLRQGKVRRA